MEKTDKPKVERPGIEEKKGRKGSGHTAEEKCRAVLSVWTERRKPGEVCRELGVAWTLLNQWQERAMEGMLMPAATSSDDGEDTGIELASCGIVGAEEQGRVDERVGAAF